MWLITNEKLEDQYDKLSWLQFEKYIFATDGEDMPAEVQDGSQLFCEGHVLPKANVEPKFSDLFGKNLLAALYSKFQDQFIQQIKGNFIVIKFRQNSFRIFSDHFGIKKFFYWQDQNQFIISNDLKAISSLVRLKPSFFGMAAYALTYHFTGGLTAFENVRHNQPAECVSLKNGILTSEKYWHPEDLLDIDRKQISIKEISESLKNATLSTLYSSDPISLSLTGGADTRNLLSIFLSMGVSPHLYTYGNPRSNDCMKTAAIAEGLGLEHQIHDIRMTAENFEDMARKIVRHGGGLASIHRGHRVMAVERESRHAKQMYLGTLGGEFIKGVSEDDYIVPAIVYENWNKTLSRTDDLEKYLDIKRIVADTDLKENLVSYVGTEPFLKGSDVHRKHQALSLITAHLHDAQDVNLYGIAMDRVYTPFLDIDYLETLFASEYTFNNKETIQNPVLRRIQNPVYGSRFIQTTYPPLLKFRYSGEHKPSEVCFNKYMAALLKGLRQKIKGTYPPNFPLGTWMAAFVRKNLPLCKDYATICRVFDLDRLMNDLESEPHGLNEAYWLKYTNPIMMRFIIEEFGHEQA
jgi:hypothetical protein